MKTGMEDNSGYKPCVGCGWCCLSDPCTSSHQKYGYVKRCPDLHWDEEQHRYVCLMMLQEDDEGAATRESQHEGEGCCAPLCSWRQDVRNRDDD